MAEKINTLVQNYTCSQLHGLHERIANEPLEVEDSESDGNPDYDKLDKGKVKHVKEAKKKRDEEDCSTDGEEEQHDGEEEQHDGEEEQHDGDEE